MRRQQKSIRIVWEYAPPPDAEDRVEAAFDMIFGKELPDEPDLTENPQTRIMPHDRPDTPAD